MFLTIIQNLLLQMFFTIGVIIAFGALIGVLNNVFHKTAGKAGRRIEIATGLIGTPVHELGHAFFCVVFSHKIVQMCLYQPKAQNGVLGYVRHSYNKKNFYQRLGNFFIGIGPVIFGSAVIFLLMLIFTPDIFRAVTNVLGGFDFASAEAGQTYLYMFQAVADTAVAVFNPKNALNVWWWFFIVLSCCIALHERISPSDIKSGIAGFWFIFIVFAVLNIIFGYAMPGVMYILTSLAVTCGAFLISFFAVSIMLYTALILIIGLVRLIVRLCKNLSRN